MDALTLRGAKLGVKPDSQSGDPIIDKYCAVRWQTLQFCQPLTIEDFGLQAIVETSPPKWHLAHTTWFFETFLLKSFVPDHQPLNPHYEVLFNSYYNGIGDQHPRAQRGLLSRPSVQAVCEYRDAINEQMVDLLARKDHPQYPEILERLILGLHHEQQHQELLLTDLKYSWFHNPLLPQYADKTLPSRPQTAAFGWMDYEGGLEDMGFNGNDAGHHSDEGASASCFDNFCFDNELPRHKVVLNPYALADRLITNGEYLAFIEDGAYENPQWWLADGWNEVRCQQWRAPLYWQHQDGQWFEYTLHGLIPLDLSHPVVHVSGYEADAFARWSDARLPTEQELEFALRQTLNKQQTINGQFVDTAEFHPRAANDNQLFGSAWEWTSSTYSPYPGFKPASGAVGEYNGKFMCNQWVLRGGSCVTSRDHIRSSYRNFFYPRDRWQFSGIRLARSL